MALQTLGSAKDPASIVVDVVGCCWLLLLSDEYIVHVLRKLDSPSIKHFAFKLDLFCPPNG